MARSEVGLPAHLTAAVSEAAAVKKVTVRVLDEAIGRGKRKINGWLWYTALLML